MHPHAMRCHAMSIANIPRHDAPGDNMMAVCSSAIMTADDTTWTPLSRSHEFRRFSKCKSSRRRLQHSGCRSQKTHAVGARARRRRLPGRDEKKAAQLRRVPAPARDRLSLRQPLCRRRPMIGNMVDVHGPTRHSSSRPVPYVSPWHGVALDDLLSTWTRDAVALLVIIFVFSLPHVLLFPSLCAYRLCAPFGRGQAGETSLKKTLAVNARRHLSMVPRMSDVAEGCADEAFSFWSIVLLA
ncbi:hypothetical protein HDK90DRAFT_156684 [Phyllosticta capitalensis]|uniref:Uncharacterized protein n=1 Tax=Phyllosticta capitalensis TaxID=121624 RepID=A0ABR1Z0Z2_9PEZI